MLKKRDLPIIALIAACALILILTSVALRPPKKAGSLYEVLVTVDGRESQVLSLPKEGESHIEIAQETGERNVLTLTPNGVHMEFSTCKNQLCVHQGEVTPENMNERALQSLIICLPNRVTAELKEVSGVDEP